MKSVENRSPAPEHAVPLVPQALDQDAEAGLKKAKRKLFSAPEHVWKSNVSWQIAITLFLTVLVVQFAILNFSSQNYEADRLAHLRDVARSSIVPLLATTVDNPRSSPFETRDVERLIATTRVTGLVVYSSQLEMLQSYGAPVSIFISSLNDLLEHKRSIDGNAYEVVFQPNELGQPYAIVATLDSSHISGEVGGFVRMAILQMVILGIFVGVVIMFIVGYWLLDPIVFLRDNLQKATESPDRPEIEDSPYKKKTEIGSAIEIALKMILNHANSLKAIKSTAEDKIHKLAYYDSLTGLPNRAMFIQNLTEKAVNTHSGVVERFAVLAVNLDHFKDINDTMGHNVGDAILRAVAKRLRASLPEVATVSRFGADEFAVMMPLTSDALTCKDVGERILGVIRAEPFKVFNENFQVRASVGVATFPDDGTEPDKVLKNADIALNRAKEEGRDKLKEFSEDFNRVVQERFQMLRDLRDALDHEQLILHFQPQLNLKTGKVIGAEALIRWFRPDNSEQGGSWVSPGEFIPVAEQSGLIIPIGEWVMRHAVDFAQELRETHDIDIRMAVNVSGVQFLQSDIVEITKNILEETGIAPHKLELEVTETVFMDDINYTIATLNNLNDLGVELAIDDFGTGYSSLSYLRQFPVDRLKVDQSFIKNALENRDDASITSTIIMLGHSLNLSVIAEGVETKGHEDFLSGENCDEVQGYRYSKPLPKEEFIKFIKEYDGNLTYFGE